MEAISDSPVGALNDVKTLVQEYVKAKEEYARRKESLSSFYAEEVERRQSLLIKSLEAAGLKSFKVDGLGTFGVVYKQTITTPKTIEEKRELFGYILDKYGQDFLDSIVSINHNSLNSFYNQEAEKSQDPALFHIPGLEAPSVKVEARFTKQRSKT
jgi:hypothetical protein